MLKLVDIVKDYRMADSVVHALKGISLNFRRSEFVSVLGPSGCGKTTLLNIIGGLDKYTDGDLIINDKSTKDFKSRDWDAYRNRSIGFVFQSYNLIPHLNILQNVELALTISGVSRKRKKALAVQALERVGLGSQLKKKPNQLSGGQMQRVAIARAIVNNPEIILADEPTGALDSKTSEQVMDLLQEIADNKLVIMVTHNPDLAVRYSTRIIELTDGEVVSDSNPYDGLPTVLSPVAPITNELSPIEKIIEEDAASENGRDGEAAVSDGAKPRKDGILGDATATTEDAESESPANGIADKSATAESGDEKFVAVLSPEKPVKLKKRSGQPKEKKQRTSMSFFTALSLSARNLMTKKTRTALTAFAGSIGIIGIALVLSLSNGFDLYMIDMQGTILSSMPLTVNSMALDIDVDELMDMGAQMGGDKDAEQFPDSDFVTPYEPEGFINGITFGANVLTDEYIDYIRTYADNNPDLFNSIKYTYAVEMPLLIKDHTGRVEKLSTSAFDNPLGWQELLWDDFMKDQFDIIAGGYPGSEAANDNLAAADGGAEYSSESERRAHQAVLVVNSYNEINKEILDTLGLRLPKDENDKYLPINFSDIIGREIVVASNDNYYNCNGVGWQDTDGDGVDDKFNTAAVNNDYAGYYDDADNTKVYIVGVLRVKSGILAPLLSTGVAYTEDLTRLCLEKNKSSEIVALQDRYSDVNVLTGDAFDMDFSAIVQIFSTVGISESAIVDMFKDILSGNGGFDDDSGIFDDLIDKIDPDELEQCETLNDIFALLKDTFNLSNETIEFILELMINMLNEKLGTSINADSIITLLNSAYKTAMQKLGGDHMPTGIYVYPVDFAAKDAICAHLDKWNEEHESSQITYTDYAGTVSALMSQVVDIVSYILIAFAAISLVVSSVMIAIITYISVLERTTEIGVLRSIGARKLDVSNVFNAETGIVGLVSGLLGVFLAWVIDFPLNAWIASLSPDFPANFAVLNPLHALILVALSIFLTVVSGLIPAIAAARKDPVKALRSTN